MAMQSPPEPTHDDDVTVDVDGKRLRSARLAELTAQLRMPAPQGLSITNSHLPSACLRNTSDDVPSICTG